MASLTHNDFYRIIDFQLTRDNVDLTDLMIEDYATLEGMMVQLEGNVVIDFGDGDILQINGVTIAELDIDNFVL